MLEPQPSPAPPPYRLRFILLNLGLVIVTSGLFVQYLQMLELLGAYPVLWALTGGLLWLGSSRLLDGSWWVRVLTFLAAGPLVGFLVGLYIVVAFSPEVLGLEPHEEGAVLIALFVLPVLGVAASCVLLLVNAVFRRWVFPSR